ncbi:MAG: hypothetical protein K1000chlam3_00245 [Chlamydiae bacterium]|nr:hypothetical protein [Chlamydiota bacterium]
MNKHSKLSNEIRDSRCLYEKRVTETITDLFSKYEHGIIDKYAFIRKMHQKYLVLFEIKEFMKKRPVDSIMIEKDNIIVNFEEGNIRLAIDCSCRSAALEVLNFGSYEQAELNMVANMIGIDQVIFDVGSHLGWFSISLANQHPKAKFYAFEPMENTFKLLRQNIELNNIQNISAYDVGLSNKERIADFFYTEAGSAVASEKDIFGMNILETVQCKLTTIDKFVLSNKINKIDFLKCDVEGAEFLVLQGGAVSISRFLPIIFLEIVQNWCNEFGYEVSDIIDFLSPLGYSVFQIEGSSLIRISGIDVNNLNSFNFIFLNEKKHTKLITQYSINT